MQIVLASQSPRRKQLLEQIGLNFIISPSFLEEKKDYNLSSEELAISLAYQKASDIAEHLQGDYLVIGADTIVVLEKEILGKPENKADAHKILQKLSGKKHQVMTGLVLIRTKDKMIKKHCEITDVYMRKFTEQEIENYIVDGEPLDKAGAYGIQGKGALLVEKINGCYFNVVGLPLEKLTCLLTDLGIKVL